MIRKLIFVVYPILILVMALATITEKMSSSSVAHSLIYGSWWFATLWALLSVLGSIYIIRCISRRLRHLRPYAICLHISLIIILCGAMLTRLSSKQGSIHLRQGEPQSAYVSSSGKKASLPFTVELLRFEVIYHSGTTSVSDYRSHLLISDSDGQHPQTVSLNNILSHKSFRLCQLSYDSDMKGTILSVNHDPWGITLSYAGYLLLFLSVLWMLIDPKGKFRQLLRSPLIGKTALLFLLIMAFPSLSRAANTLPKAQADSLCSLLIYYNGRICPMETVALDLTRKLYGSSSYKGLSANQVLSGWLFYGDQWENEPFIKVKSGTLRSTLMLPSHCSLSSFFNKKMGGYVLGPYIREYYSGQNDAFHSQAASLDGRIELLLRLRQGSLLKFLPVTFHESHSRNHTEEAISPETTIWYAPADNPHSSIDRQKRAFLKNVLSLMTAEIRENDSRNLNDIIAKISLYQKKETGQALPSPTKLWAEHVNNTIPLATILFILNLSLGLLSLSYIVAVSYKLKPFRHANTLMAALLALSLLALSFLLALRWIITSHVPMSNGYETMLLLSWCVLLISLLLMRKTTLSAPFGFFLAGLFLLVSHLNLMDPAIGQMMPVLNSPLLSLHVSLIMMAYALASITFLCSLIALANKRMAPELQTLSQLCLFPTIAFMCLGIFVGAIWAGESWGRYWGWDAKETWALITLMIYAIALHAQSIPRLQRPLPWHLFMLLAFISILITYFGVNYFLGGMHSYA